MAGGIERLLSMFGERILYVTAIGEKALYEDDRVSILIGHQCARALTENEAKIVNRLKNTPKVTYLKFDSVGVTKSRNALISQSSAKIVWFLDDDIVWWPGAVDTILAAFSERNGMSVDVVTFQVKSPDGLLRKNYWAKARRHSNFSILRIGTIEIAARRKFLVDNLVVFPEDMGAGCYWGAGDESVFLASAMKARGNVMYIPKPIAVHPMESSGDFARSTGFIEARGVVFRRVYGWYGVPLLLAFGIKHVRRLGRHLSIKLYFTALFRGYRVGKNSSYG